MCRLRTDEAEQSLGLPWPERCHVIRVRTPGAPSLLDPTTTYPEADPELRAWSRAGAGVLVVVDP
jgi:hypothetical protein